MEGSGLGEGGRWAARGEGWAPMAARWLRNGGGGLGSVGPGGGHGGAVRLEVETAAGARARRDGQRWGRRGRQHAPRGGLGEGADGGKGVNAGWEAQARL